MSAGPPELIDSIIDCLHNSPRVLKTCTLVARSWLPRSRVHLFRRLHLHFEESSRKPSLNTYLANFRSYILSNPTIISCVEDLSLDLRVRPSPPSPNDIMDTVPENLPFTNLKSLDIGKPLYAPTPDASKWRASRILTLIKQNPGLQKLVVFGCDLGRSDEPEAQDEAELLAYIVTSMPGLQSLRICEFDVPFASIESERSLLPTPSNPSGHLVSLQTLAIEHCQFGLGQRLFPRTGDLYRLPELVSLVLLDCNRPDDEGNFQLVNQYPRTIKHLVIALSEMNTEVTNASWAEMSNLTDLVLYWSTPEQLITLLQHFLEIDTVKLQFLRLNQLFLQSRAALALLDAVLAAFISQTPSLQRKVAVLPKVNQHNDEFRGLDLTDVFAVFPIAAQSGMVEMATETDDLHDMVDEP
ncbi:hypothetical protein D9758_003458 [Tetrapyrgos nigripes]|uniref:Uncharacterized protein n=1 Tax=Tetrapyrgos nigripes TaxID=182062 RepID=A0A8H5GUZ4_9AGAR|nr:hypothetical protein D9758_003458 [Tetrapyrgos nigripes]